MKREHEGDHVWACMQAQGHVGEIKSYKMLSDTEVQAASLDPSKIEEVCPAGTIVCNTCETPFAPGALSLEPTVDFEALRVQLVKETPVETSQ